MFNYIIKLAHSLTLSHTLAALHYKTHTLFDTITHAIHTNISGNPMTLNRKTNPIAAKPPSIDNVHMVPKSLS